MKKILASLLVLAMVFAMVACSSQGSQTTAAPTANNETSAAAASENSTSDETRHKIGMIWYGNTDAMGGTFYAWANHAAELLNVDLVWHLGDFTTEAELAAAEQMITDRNVLNILMDESAGNITSAEISSDPTRFMARTIMTAIITAISRLYIPALVPAVLANVSSNVTAKILL